MKQMSVNVLWRVPLVLNATLRSERDRIQGFHHHPNKMSLASTEPSGGTDVRWWVTTNGDNSFQ
jgi:hypothetical protein